MATSAASPSAPPSPVPASATAPSTTLGPAPAANPAPAPACTVVIFGATGDLARRKLFPALYGLEREGLLAPATTVVAIGRREKTQEEFQAELAESIRRHSRFAPDMETGWTDFSRRFSYFRLEMHDTAGYRRLADLLDREEAARGLPRRRVYYLSVMPDLFEPITAHLKAAGMVGPENDSRSACYRVVIEKPFGYDLTSAEELNRQIGKVFREEQIYRIDHYLGKEMTQNISVLRFANVLFEPVWNNRYIENVQITSSETVGVEERGEYYDKTGALRDMVQNHMLQLLSLVAMEPPTRPDSESIRDAKVNVLRSLKRWERPADVATNVVRGQYGPGRLGGKEVAGYRSEPEVRPDSTTETFVAMRVFVETPRWRGVPFYIRTGKRLPAKATEIHVQFRHLPNPLYPSANGPLVPNRVVFRIQPLEGVFLQVNAKRPGAHTQITPVALDFCQNCAAPFNSPEAYERLLFDVMRGDPTLFTRWDEVRLAWEFIDPIVEAWQRTRPHFPNYAAGSWGPAAAGTLLTRRGHHWWSLQDKEG